MAPEVRLSGPDNEPLGIVPLQEALRMAGELDVDLVEIAATAVPPVCRLMDYGKFKYQEQKKAAEAKAKQTVIEIKEVKFRPGTDDGDYNIKLRNIRRFLADGDKVKVTLRFRGREITHQQLGLNLLNRLRDDLADSIQVEQFPKLEGRQMIMMVAPARAGKSLLQPQKLRLIAPLLHLKPQIRHNCCLALQARVGSAHFCFVRQGKNCDLRKSGSGKGFASRQRFLARPCLCKS